MKSIVFSISFATLLPFSSGSDNPFEIISTSEEWISDDRTRKVRETEIRIGDRKIKDISEYYNDGEDGYERMVVKFYGRPDKDGYSKRALSIEYWPDGLVIEPAQYQSSIVRMVDLDNSGAIDRLVIDRDVYTRESDGSFVHEFSQLSDYSRKEVPEELWSAFETLLVAGTFPAVRSPSLADPHGRSGGSYSLIQSHKKAHELFELLFSLSIRDAGKLYALRYFRSENKEKYGELKKRIDVSGFVEISFESGSVIFPLKIGDALKRLEEGGFDETESLLVDPFQVDDDTN